MVEFDDRDWWQMSLESQMTEFPRIRQGDVTALREWLGKQPHLPRLSGELLGVFLAACNYSIEGAKRAIEINYTLRTRNPRIFASRNIDLQEMEIVRKYFQMGILPQRKGRPAVIAYGFRPMDSSLWDLEAVLRASYMLQDVSTLLLGPVPEGYIYICDMKHWTLGHILRSPLTICAAFIKYSQEGSCCKIHQYHFMNAGPILEKFLAMVRPFISDEVWRVMTMHEKTDGLQKYLPPEQIPKDYGGGTADTLDELTDKAIGQLRDHLEWFRGEEVLRVKEELRPPGSKPLLEDGLQGSFRKLDID